MTDEKPSYNFHTSTKDFQRSVKIRSKPYGEDESPNWDYVTWFRKLDRIFVKKYGCSRCPNRGTSLCPYGVGKRQNVSKGKPMDMNEKLIRLNDDGTKTIEVDSYRDGICPERVRELSFFTAKVTNMNGLLQERAENMLAMRDLKDKMEKLIVDLKDEPATFRTEDGDVRAKTLLTQYQDSVSKYDTFLSNAINQQIKYDELKLREKEGPRVLDMDAIKIQLSKANVLPNIVPEAKLTEPTKIETTTEKLTSLLTEVADNDDIDLSSMDAPEDDLVDVLDTEPSKQ